VVLRLFQVARRFQMEVQPQLVLLQKTLFAIEGLGRQLYPELDLWETAKPFLEKWLREQVGPKAILRQLKQNLPFIAEQLPQIPKLLFEVLELKKEQLQIDKALFSTQKDKNNQSIQWKSIAIGAFASFLSIAAMNYLHLIDYKQLTSIALTGMVLAGLVALMSRNESN